MIRFLLKGAALSLAAFLVVASGNGEVSAQIPDEFTNLKLLPKEITKGELIGIMRNFAGGLGVRCNHCHVGPDNLQGMDFATDEKATKRTARLMLKMVNEINGSFLKEIETDRTERMEVKCQTCHHRLTVPRPVEEVVAATIESDGVEAAIEEYKNLREEHYGGASYDFSPTPLNSLAERLARAKQIDNALALLFVNVEYHPKDTWTLMLMGGLHKAASKTKDAISWYKKALKLDPKNEHIKKAIERLKAGK